MIPTSNRMCLLAGAATVLTLAAWAGLAQNSTDTLERGFQNPPDRAKPRVWWHWMNGNISKEGIQLDLEWMKRVGIGGLQNFDAALATPQIVPKRLIYMTPEWKDAFRYAVTLADQLGLEMAIAGSPGWSESGGPWVPPAQAMKKLVWSETRIEGGRPFTGVLRKPPSVAGPFQNIPRAQGLGAQAPPPAEFYADAAVVACRLPESDLPIGELHPKLTASGGQFDLAGLTDGDLVQATALPMAPPNESAWIQFEFPAPQSIRALTLVVQGGARRNPFGAPAEESGPQLQASDDGEHFRTVVRIPTAGVVSHTLAFPPVTARFFRVSFPSRPARPQANELTSGLRPSVPPATAYQVAELILHPGARVNRFEEKAAFATLPDLSTVPTPPVAARDAISRADVVDLTSMMRADGTLDWAPPAGRWVVLRMGYSLLGVTNHPASPEATGPEVDKLNRKYVKAYLDNYLGQYQATVGALMGKRGLQYVITDSWEAGPQNWTDDMIAEFNQRRGYDMRPWLPVLTGRVVESAEASERFLWDFRRTIADLTAEYHYDQITASLRERGMGRYSESHETGRAFVGDGMEVKRNADVPMSAMWVPTPGQGSRSYGSSGADIQESASVAHLYGQNLVAAESLTAIGTAWAWSPETLKPTADKELANGLNRFVLHTSVHQPVSDKVPGLGLGPFGQWFTRHETWAELAQPWITYLARSSYMLQQGRFVADVLYYYGEDSNITALFESQAPDVPAGYRFDFVNADAILHRLSVSGGRITTPNGMSYRLLALDPRSRHMSLPVLCKLREFVSAGASVVGPMPTDDPSLSDNMEEFRAAADQLWGSGAGEHAYGKGKVYADRSVPQALTAIQPVPDFEYTKAQPDTNLLFVHRALADGEVYWVANRNHRLEIVEAAFRVLGKAPELWRPETGAIEPASYRIAGGRTTVPLRLEPDEAVFVVFRKPSGAPSRSLPQPVETRLALVDGAWEVSFQPGRGAPEKLTLDRLSTWTENVDPGVKYFSGTATYTKTIEAPGAWFTPGARLWLSLGDVKNLAQVAVNGQSLGILWKAPFRIDVTGVLKPGVNELQIKVTNLWVNRLIGDQQPNMSRKCTYTTQPFYRADSPLLPSGLLGPVEMVRAQRSVP